MKKIGEGLQYTVYSDGERVRKEPKSRKEMIEMAKKWYKSQEKAENNVDMALERRAEALNKLKERNFPDFIFGNLEIKEKTVYQDRLIPVSDKLDSSEDLEEKKDIIDDYINLLKTLWSYGIGDTIYNFTINNGYDGKSRIVQMDFGEIVFSKEKIKEEIVREKWLEKQSYNHDLDKELKPYFKEKMNEEITLDELEKNWKKAI